jgi:hypothetical protein
MSAKALVTLLLRRRSLHALIFISDTLISAAKKPITLHGNGGVLMFVTNVTLVELAPRWSL